MPATILGAVDIVVNDSCHHKNYILCDCTKVLKDCFGCSVGGRVDSKRQRRWEMIVVWTREVAVAMLTSAQILGHEMEILGGLNK